MNNDRDTHFSGFARLQRLRVSEAIEQLMAENKSPVINPAEFNQRVETILAQCDYDLVVHAFVSNTPELFDAEAQEMIRDIPDLTQWPE